MCVVYLLVDHPFTPIAFRNVGSLLIYYCNNLISDNFRFLIDTWQYFLHRFFHTNRYLYKHIHSIHHRLYVPYAFGALYNHPLEGFLLDSVGAAMAHSVSLMTTRQAIVLFALSSFKTVDDHCGYRLPLDPLQLFFGNNADYHDIHHQVTLSRNSFHWFLSY